MMNTMEQRGFTLVETLVAITIIAIAIVGPLYAVQQALNASRSARDLLIASSLAQEAVEYVRAVRDSNYLYTFKSGANRSWLFGVDGTSGSTNCFTAVCVVDPSQNVNPNDSYVSRTVTKLYRNAAGLYNQQGNGQQTPFTRTIQLASVQGTSDEVVLTVVITWTQKGIPQRLEITERLHNWL